MIDNFHAMVFFFFFGLGDLARYKELCEKPDVQSCNWSVAATYYLEATMIWPDSGNPQNQLAVLAIYVGDEFLALYHCVRSLAVKEPFLDAWENLYLLFEKNRLSNPQAEFEDTEGIWIRLHRKELFTLMALDQHMLLSLLSRNHYLQLEQELP